MGVVDMMRYVGVWKPERNLNKEEYHIWHWLLTTTEKQCSMIPNCAFDEATATAAASHSTYIHTFLQKRSLVSSTPSSEKIPSSDFACHNMTRHDILETAEAKT